MREILRVLKPGGNVDHHRRKLQARKTRFWKRPVMKLLKSTSLGVDDQRALFSSAGYADVEVFEERTKGWVCVTGKKPANPRDSRQA
jgi:hypothetical protein